MEECVWERKKRERKSESERERERGWERVGLERLRERKIKADSK